MIPPTQARPSKYFGAAPKEEIADKLLAKVEQYEKNTLVSQHQSRQKDAWTAYFGYSPDGFHASSMVARAGEMGELASVKVNHARSLAQALLNLLTSAKFTWVPVAANLDNETIDQTKLAKAALEHFWRAKQVSNYTHRAAESGVVFTEGFVFCEWDKHAGSTTLPQIDETGAVVGAAQRSGDIKFYNPESWDVTRDPSAKSWDHLAWKIVKIQHNKYDLVARYPDVDPEEIEKNTLDGAAQSTLGASFESDDVPVYYFLHKPNAVMPLGRIVKFLKNKTVLEDKKWDDSCDLHRVSPAEITDTPFGHSQFIEILGLQQLSDSIHSTLATNISTFGVQSIAVEAGSAIDVDELTGMKVVYHPVGTKPPVALQLTANSPDSFKYVDQLKSLMELIMGLNAVVRGEAPTNVESGAGLALLQSQALQQASILSGNYHRMLEALGSTLLRIIKAHAKLPFKIGILGQSRTDVAQETEVKPGQLSGVESVYVELGNAIVQSAAGRYELGQQMMQMGLVKTPEALIQVLETGNMDPLTKGPSEQLANIVRESQELSKGIVPDALLTDPHILHFQEHLAVLSSPAARRDPKVVKVVFLHLHKHYALYFNIPFDPAAPPEMISQAVSMDPFYHERMMFMSGQPPPPPVGMAGMPPPGAEGAPPGQPSPPKVESSLDQMVSESVQSPGQNAEDMLPNMPTNPASGQTWNAQDGGAGPQAAP